jgi:hypothetical protein
MSHGSPTEYPKDVRPLFGNVNRSEGIRVRSIDALQGVVMALRDREPSRENSLAITKVEEAMHWLQSEAGVTLEVTPAAGVAHPNTGPIGACIPATATEAGAYATPLKEPPSAA